MTGPFVATSPRAPFWSIFKIIGSSICFLIVPLVAWKGGSSPILAFSSSAVIVLVTMPQEPAMELLMQYKSLIGSMCRKTSPKLWNAPFIGIGRPFNRSS
jgi:hypothetical protein